MKIRSCLWKQINWYRVTRICLRWWGTYSKQDLWTIKPHLHSAKAAVTNTVPTANFNSAFLKKTTTIFGWQWWWAEGKKMAAVGEATRRHSLAARSLLYPREIRRYWDDLGLLLSVIRHVNNQARRHCRHLGPHSSPSITNNASTHYLRWLVA